MKDLEQKCRKINEVYLRAVQGLSEVENQLLGVDVDKADMMLNLVAGQLQQIEELIFPGELALLRDDYQDNLRALRTFFDVTIMKNKKIAIPDWDTIRERLSPYLTKYREMMKTGLGPKLQITPIGVELDTFVKAWRERIAGEGHRKIEVLLDSRKLLYGPKKQSKAQWVKANDGFLIDLVLDKAPFEVIKVEAGNSATVPWRSLAEMVVKILKDAEQESLNYESLVFSWMRRYVSGSENDQNVNQMILGVTLEGFEGAVAFALNNENRKEIIFRRDDKGKVGEKVVVPRSVRIK